MSRDSDSPGEEFKVAVAGPLVTAAVVGLCIAISAGVSRFGDFADSAQLSSSDTTPALALLGWLAIINAVLFVFNMVPAFPLDGGRIARAVAWKITGDKNRGTRFSARVGQGFAYLLIGVGSFLLFTSDPVNGLWFIVLGFFLGQAARGAVASTHFAERIEGVTAADLMDDEPVSVPSDATALRAQDEFFLRYRWPWFPVVDTAGRYRRSPHRGPRRRRGRGGSAGPRGLRTARGNRRRPADLEGDAARVAHHLRAPAPARRADGRGR